VSAEFHPVAGQFRRRRRRISKGARYLVTALIVYLGLAASGKAAAQDFLHTNKGVPATPASPLLREHTCIFGPLGQPLRLQEAVERALCNNPKTREAWANVEIQAAAVGAARAAYLPTLSTSVQEVRDRTSTVIGGYPQLTSRDDMNTASGSASLSWVLYDFGGRNAAIKNASQLLAAAQASHEGSLQDAFADVSKHYYAAQAAQGTLTTAIENERTANESLQVAKRRADSGVSPISDALQAETAYVQAVVSRTKAEGDLQAAIGAMAVDMGLRPDEPVVLPEVEEGGMPDDDFQESVSSLIDGAMQQHPSVRAAWAEFKAAEAKVAQTRAAGLPSFGLAAKLSRNTQPASLGLGLPPYPATVRDGYFGVQVSVPIFEGFVRDYQIRQAKAQMNLQGEVLYEARQQAALDVWTNYQLVQSTTQNITNSAKLLEIALESYTAAQRRYMVGVGSVVELLSTQSSLATARQQRVQALTDWRSSRLQLAAKLGRLGMPRIAGQ